MRPIFSSRRARFPRRCINLPSSCAAIRHGQSGHPSTVLVTLHDVVRFRPCENDDPKMSILPLVIDDKGRIGKLPSGRGQRCCCSSPGGDYHHASFYVEAYAEKRQVTRAQEAWRQLALRSARRTGTSRPTWSGEWRLCRAETERWFRLAALGAAGDCGVPVHDEIP